MRNGSVKAPLPGADDGDCVFKSRGLTWGGNPEATVCWAKVIPHAQKGQNPDPGLHYFQIIQERIGAWSWANSWISYDLYYYKWLRCRGERNKEFLFFLFFFFLSFLPFSLSFLIYHWPGTAPSTYQAWINLIPTTAPWSRYHYPHSKDGLTSRQVDDFGSSPN